MAEPGMNASAVAGQLVMGVDPDGKAQHMAALPASALGTPADTAWDGATANPTLFALLKAIAINTQPAS